MACPASDRSKFAKTTLALSCKNNYWMTVTVGVPGAQILHAAISKLLLYSHIGYPASR